MQVVVKKGADDGAQKHCLFNSFLWLRGHILPESYVLLSLQDGPDCNNFVMKVLAC